MLAADKLLLRSTVKQRTIELREKELNLFNSNFSAVATQAALLAGFSMAFLEMSVHLHALHFNPLAKGLLHVRLRRSAHEPTPARAASSAYLRTA